ncbi:hypothetical protein B0T26DRAFT_343992 [Lasiosphaeria miniovina]|uniref:Uncharacterized protein n=1 Tax=Lasiosphaeria miniovina TaxID=1954250 RepID=A0AA40AB70_9PEZI|nr:uncharacterized protein B0T26DRAFT_343992 [Lasiosphaeria miniovina]KAK0712710.1 hypothetical protein B0T26DRAFT_343992 [Lasiosphaeria miniovina]
MFGYFSFAFLLAWAGHGKKDFGSMTFPDFVSCCLFSSFARPVLVWRVYFRVDRRYGTVQDFASHVTMFSAHCLAALLAYLLPTVLMLGFFLPARSTARDMSCFEPPSHTVSPSGGDQ